ncbi:hypothetical protein ACFQHV_00925 [Promicromonospora thailandica]|uniref:Uncharacterized protein n=1 Tax=Promicromonospora thailandica TaxID=765201 RepID=A0A9X2G4J9_9MICO|nr:hypothetical protein [Promicromonospora thailandica]MCP2265583.1 hypothetical protein [Promicromonospora thailandica]BFF17144.1 hypothetical protein GCM10025730_06650 [Promicromonospora thailandica]
MSDLVASWLRTVVPTVWSAVIGTVLAWLAVHAGWVLDVLELLNIDPTSTAFTTGVVTLVLAAWYLGWRKLEPYIPDWLTRLVLGSAKMPTYAPVSSDGVHTITQLTPAERRLIEDVRATEGR